VPEDYVHRIGRTGRAGTPGHAVSLVSPDDQEYLRGIERLIKKRLHLVPMPGYEGPPPADMVESESRPPREPRGQGQGRGNGRGPRREGQQPGAPRKPQGPKPAGGRKPQGERRPQGERLPQGEPGNTQPRAAAPEVDDENFGNSIHYKPRQPQGGGRGRGQQRALQPQSVRIGNDPDEPRRNTLSIPQSMPGEPGAAKPRGGAGAGGGRGRSGGGGGGGRSGSGRGPRQEDGAVRSNLPPHLAQAMRRGR
jgi:ATP-dependent RNA helicase RhlE